MATYREEQTRRRRGWMRTPWVLTAVLVVAIAVAIVLIVLYTGGGGSGGGGGY